jgi:hypothetical protein
MKTSGALKHALHAIGFSDGGMFAGDVGLAALNSVLWASIILLGIGLATTSRSEPTSRQCQRAGTGRDSHGPPPLQISSNSEGHTLRSPARGTSLTSGNKSSAMNQPIIVPQLTVQVVTGDTPYSREDGVSSLSAELIPEDSQLIDQLASAQKRRQVVTVRCAVLDTTGRITNCIQER